MNRIRFGHEHLSQPLDCVLGGGGIKGLSHVGFLRAITEKGITFADFHCTSIGAVIGAFFTNGFTPEEIEKIFFEELDRFGKSTFADSAKRPNLANLRQGGLLNIAPIFESIIRRYNLKPQNNLKIIAARVSRLQFQPYLFEGTDYDLTEALTAACAMPPFISTITTKNPSIRLMDGGLFHATPYQLCQKRAIISRLGVAERFPAKPFDMPPFDLLIHLLEQLASAIKNYRNRVEGDFHLVIKTGDPQIATFAFGLSDEACRYMVTYGYRQTLAALDRL